MSEHKDELGLPIGFPVLNWTPCARPSKTPMEGRFCRLEPLDADRHAADLHAANLEDHEDRIWAYLPYGPFGGEPAYRSWVEAVSAEEDPFFHAIIDGETGKAIGVASYLRIEPAVGVIEVGHINYAPPLQNNPAGTEAMFLMMRRAFDELEYRRYEWKCDSLNARSRAAAERLGFRYEGLFRQATMYKGRNRDTAWYGIIDRDWPMLKAAFERWFDPANFDAEGRQRTRLSELTRAVEIRGT